MATLNLLVLVCFLYVAFLFPIAFGADRAARRAELAADPAWQAYLAKSAEAGYLVSQVNKILMPAPFMAD